MSSQKHWRSEPKSSDVNTHKYTLHHTERAEGKLLRQVYFPQRRKALISKIPSASPALERTRLALTKPKMEAVSSASPFRELIWLSYMGCFLEHRITTLWNANCFCYPAWSAWKMRCKLRHNKIMAALTLFKCIFSSPTGSGNWPLFCLIFSTQHLYPTSCSLQTTLSDMPTITLRQWGFIFQTNISEHLHPNKSCLSK